MITGDVVIPVFCKVDDRMPSVKKQPQGNKRSSWNDLMFVKTALSKTALVYDLKHFHHCFQNYINLACFARFATFVRHTGTTLYVFLRVSMDQCASITFVNSTPQVVRHNRRIGHHWAFDGWSECSTTTAGWFYCFKLPLFVDNPNPV